MKILIVNSKHFYGGGDSAYTFNLAALLRTHGHVVSFFAMKDKNNIADDNEDLFVDNIDYRELHYRKNFGNAVRVLTHAIFSSEAYHKFERMVTRTEPDIIHVQSLHHYITPSILLIAKKRKIPVVWTLHDFKMICPNTHFIIDGNSSVCEACKMRSYYKAFLKRCKKASLMASMVIMIESYMHMLLGVRNMIDLFIAPSIFLKNKLVDFGFPSRSIVQIDNFVKANSEPCFLNQKYFLFFGKIEAIKGIRYLIEAAKLTPNIKIKIAGSYDPPFINVINNLPFNVEYVGFKRDDELEILVRQSIAVVMPSLCYENQPMSVLEAFARGKPVIASNIGGLIELVGHNERGFLFEAGNARSLADRLLQMKGDPDTVKSMGHKAYQYVRQHHNPELHYEKLIHAYNKLSN